MLLTAKEKDTSAAKAKRLAEAKRLAQEAQVKRVAEDQNRYIFCYGLGLVG